MGKSSKQTTTQSVDPTTQALQRLTIGSALGALGIHGLDLTGDGRNDVSPLGPQLQPVPGVSPLTQQSIGAYQAALPAFNLGLGALSGNQGAVQQLMNPFQSNVLDAVKGQYNDLANLTTNNINDQATQAGAFGGTRHGVAEGVALGQLDKGLGQQLAGLQYQGYQDAMNRAGGLTNLGLGAAGQLASLGDYTRQVQMAQDPAMRQLSILQGLLSGNPVAMSTTQTQSGSLLNGLLGLGLTAGGLGWHPFGKAGG